MIIDNSPYSACSLLAFGRLYHEAAKKINARSKSQARQQKEKGGERIGEERRFQLMRIMQKPELVKSGKTIILNKGRHYEI